MADKMINYAPEWTYDESLVMREPIIKLGRMITDRIPIVLGTQKITPQDPEYWAVATICPTDEMAEIALRMKKRHPRTLADMKKRCLPTLKLMRRTKTERCISTL